MLLPYKEDYLVKSFSQKQKETVMTSWWIRNIVSLLYTEIPIFRFAFDYLTNRPMNDIGTLLKI